MPTDTPRRDTGGTVVAALMILICAVAWWDTTTMGDPDSYVFPRAVIVAMVGFSLLLILFNLMRPTMASGDNGVAGSYLRRILLVAVMLAGAGVMPLLGFVVSGLLVFAALTGIAMYDPWTRFRTVVYPISGIAIVAGFYVLFAKFLLVPLPLGFFFE